MPGPIESPRPDGIGGANATTAGGEFLLGPPRLQYKEISTPDLSAFLQRLPSEAQMAFFQNLAAINRVHQNVDHSLGNMKWNLIGHAYSEQFYANLIAEELAAKAKSVGAAAKKGVKEVSTQVYQTARQELPRTPQHLKNAAKFIGTQFIEVMRGETGGTITPGAAIRTAALTTEVATIAGCAVMPFVAVPKPGSPSPDRPTATATLVECIGENDANAQAVQKALTDEQRVLSENGDDFVLTDAHSDGITYLDVGLRTKDGQVIPVARIAESTVDPNVSCVSLVDPNASAESKNPVVVFWRKIRSTSGESFVKWYNRLFGAGNSNGSSEALANVLSIPQPTGPDATTTPAASSTPPPPDTPTVAPPTPPPPDTLVPPPATLVPPIATEPVPTAVPIRPRIETQQPLSSIKIDFERNDGPVVDANPNNTPGKTYGVVSDGKGGKEFKAVVNLEQPQSTEDGHIRLYNGYAITHDGPYSVGWDMRIAGKYASGSPKELVSVLTIHDQGDPVWHAALTIDLVEFGGQYYPMPHHNPLPGSKDIRTRGSLVDGAKPFQFDAENHLDVDVTPDGNVFVFLNGNLVSVGTKDKGGGMSPQEVKIEKTHLGLYSNDRVTQLELEEDNIVYSLY